MTNVRLGIKIDCSEGVVVDEIERSLFNLHKVKMLLQAQKLKNKNLSEAKMMAEDILSTALSVHGQVSHLIEKEKENG